MKGDLALYTEMRKERYHRCKGLAGAPSLVVLFIRDTNSIQAVGPGAVVF